MWPSISCWPLCVSSSPCQDVFRWHFCQIILFPLVYNNSGGYLSSQLALPSCEFSYHDGTEEYLIKMNIVNTNSADCIWDYDPCKGSSWWPPDLWQKRVSSCPPPLAFFFHKTWSFTSFLSYILSPPSCPWLLVSIPAGIFFIDPQMTDNLPNFLEPEGKAFRFLLLFFFLELTAAFLFSPPP